MPRKYYIPVITLSIFFFLFSSVAEAQTENRAEVKVIYYTFINKKLPPSTLYLKPQKSIFVWAAYDSTYVAKKSNRVTSRKFQLNISFRTDEGFFVCKNLNKSKMYSKQSSFDEPHYVREKISSISWRVRPEKKRIAGYMTRKATGVYKGRHYTVWYTPQIPIPNGPWKLGGLPGLILKAKDNSGKVKFAVKSIKQGITADDVFSTCFAKEAIAWNRYKANVNKSWQNFIKFLESGMSIKTEVEVNNQFHIEKSIFEDGSKR